MSLRSKILFSILLVLGIFTALIYAIDRTFIWPNFIALERDEARKNVRRCIEAIQKEVERVDTICADWAAWDDSYQFVQDHNAKFIESNLTEDSFGIAKVNLIYICNPGGQVVWGQIYDFYNDTKVEIEEFPLLALSQDHPLLLHAIDTGSLEEAAITGVFSTSQGPLLISARPVLTSKTEGPPQGTIIMGRFLDDHIINAVKESTMVHCEVWPTAQQSSPEDIQAIREHLTSDRPFHIVAVDDRILRVYSLIPDIGRANPLLLRADISRQITQKGKHALRLTFFSILIVGAGVSVVLLLLLQRMIVSPILRLTRHAIAAGRSEDLSKHLTLKQSGEIGTLAREFDNMVDRLADIQKKLIDKETGPLRQQIEFILGATKTGLIVVDLESNIHFVDPELKKIYGEYKDKKCYSYFKARDTSCPDCGAKKALKTKSIVVHEESLSRENNRSVQVTSIPFQGQDGQWLVTQLKVDISDTKCAEQQLEALAKFPSEDPAPVLRIAQDGTILYANQAGNGLLKSWGKQRGQSCPDDMYDMVLRVLDSGVNEYLEIECGDAIFSLTCVPVADSDYVNLYGHNITYEKTVENELKYSNQNMEETVRDLSLANLELQDFARAVSHDLKSPVRAIGTLADWLLRDNASKLGPDSLEQVNMIVGRASRMETLIDSLLQYCGVGRIKEEKQQTDLNMLIAEIIKNINPPQHVEIVVCEQLPTIECKVSRLTQVFSNLISNAVKFIDKPKGMVKIHYAERDDCWEFSIEDNGPGIESKYLEKIFKVFQTLSPRDEVEGAGIGLALVKKIVEEVYYSHLWVESEPGLGSTFSFTLPKNDVETGVPPEDQSISCERFPDSSKSVSHQSQV